MAIISDPGRAPCGRTREIRLADARRSIPCVSFTCNDRARSRGLRPVEVGRLVRVMTH